MRKLNRIMIVFFIFAYALTFCGFAEENVPYKGASPWAVSELDKAAGYGLITDKIKGNMNESITREEFAELAVRLYEKYTGKSAVYSDMSAFVDTANPEVFKAHSLNIVNGTDLQRKLFSPGQFTNREQIAAMMFRRIQAIKPDANFSAGETGIFIDENDVSDWALESVKFMIKNGFLRGADGKINPMGTCTREMAVLIATRVYEYYSGTGDETGIGAYNWDWIVINDTAIFRDNYEIKNKDGFYYIFIEAERFKYAFKLPYAGSHTYPNVEVIGGKITATWNSGDDIVLKVELSEENTEAVMNDTKIDAGMAPYSERGKMHIPINLFISAMDMDVESSSNNDTLYVQYKNVFPAEILEGTWSDTGTDLFTALKDIETGSSTLPSYATAYKFYSNGTYELIRVSAGGSNDTIIKQRGKYKVMGSTVMYYEIYETIYKGSPFTLKHEDRPVGIPNYEFISNYDSGESKIEIGGFWFNKL